MTEDVTQKEITTVSINSLELLHQRLTELGSNGERVVTNNELLVFEFLISKLRADNDLHEHLARMMLRVDALEKNEGTHTEIIQAVIKDARETRRLTLAAVERVDILQATMSAAIDEIDRVSKQATEQAKMLTAQVDKVAKGLSETSAAVADIAEELKP